MVPEIDALLKQLSTADLKTAAYYLVHFVCGLGGVYAHRTMRALMLFSTVPCPETGAVLVTCNPELLETLMTPHDDLMTDVETDELEYDPEDYHFG